MNMTPVAQAVQRQGRGDDTMLVHMTPGEVGGLQALAMAHGGSLSINPNTGLPEAGFLKNILPTLLGVGLSFIPGVGPLAAGMITGGIETVRTGDIGKGFLAGLGAYGGANLAGGLKAAGGAASSATAGATGSAEALAAQTAGNQTAAETARLTAANQAAGIGATPSTFMGNVSQAGQGFQNLVTGQPGSFDRFIGDAAVKADAAKGIAASPATGLGGGYGAAKTVGMAAAPALMAGPEYAPPSRTEEESNYEGPYTPSERRVSYPNDDLLRRRTSEFTYFTPSNPVPFERGGSVPQLEDGGFVLTKKAVDGLGRGSNKKGQKVASRGLGAIPIKGPGTGTSDSIKTSIDGKRPALVSNGEAYVPKKQVAKKGGAKAFYALMSKAEKAADKRKRA